MNTIKPRKACVNCYQKKVRCDWSETAPNCSYCLNHGLDCFLPGPSEPPPSRTAVRDKLAELDERLRRLESESKNQRGYSEALVPGDSATTAQEYSPAPLFDWNLSNGRGSAIGGEQALVTHVLQETLLGDRPTLGPNYSSNSRLEREILSSKESNGERGARHFHGNSSPWNVLVNGTAAVSDLSTGPFNETISRLADEERSMNTVTGPVEFDILAKFPLLSVELVWEYTERYRAEAPFPIVHWPTLEESIINGLASKRWNHSGQVVCVLLYMAFGSAHLNISRPSACEEYFQQAWNMLPQLLLEQDLWALKGLTLIVHYLQGGSLPEPCYTLLGSASRMAISLGFHRKHYDKTYTPVEMEEGKRCWWLCYIQEKTFSLVLGRPSTNLDISETEVPRPFLSSETSSSNALMRISFPEGGDSNDVEAVHLFVDLIEIARTRDRIMCPVQARRKDEFLHIQLTSKLESTNEILSHWRAASKLRRPLVFDATGKGSLRETICDLCYYNSLISLDRFMKADFETTMSSESIQASRATIKLLTDSKSGEMTMCLWMWLYYGFSSAVVLFLDVIYNPLHTEATLNLALVSDLENLCASLATYSPGAKRVMEVSKEMNRLAFEVIKAKAKRKAQADQQSSISPEEKSKRRRMAGVEAHQDGGAANDGSSLLDSENVQDQNGSEETAQWNEIPVNFSWDDWDQWLNGTSF